MGARLRYNNGRVVRYLDGCTWSQHPTYGRGCVEKALPDGKVRWGVWRGVTFHYDVPVEELIFKSRSDQHEEILCEPDS